MRYLLIISIYIFLTLSVAHAQNLSTEGTDFWFGFMDNWLQDPDNPIILELYISADDTTSGVVEIPRKLDFVPIEFQVNPGITTRIELPANIAETNSINLVDLTGIHLYTTRDVTVYAMNKRQYSADVAVILPTLSLGNEYIVMSHWEEGNQNNGDNSDSEFLIVATNDNTTVQITPTVTTEGGFQANVPFDINLNQGETYQVQARADLTGTTVIGLDNGSGSCSNFALFAGNQYTKVGSCDAFYGHDHLYEQMYPVKTWGTDYTIVEFEGRIGGDVVKIMAAEDNTKVTVTGETHIINRSEHLFLTLTGINSIHADKPVAVGHFSRSMGCDDTLGDPFFILISPDQQLLRSITFNAPTIATVTDYALTVVVPTYDVPNVLFDGYSISSRFHSVPDNPAMSYARVVTTAGNHSLFSEVGFIAYVYGYGWNESFGYATGAGLSNLSLGVEITNQLGVSIPTDSLCLFDQQIFKPITAKKYDSYVYNFGDGTQVIKDNKDSVIHEYNKSGTYIFSLSGIVDSGNCGAGGIDTEVRILNVINPQLEIRGPRSICPNTTGVNYYVEHNLYYYNEWFVSGGTFTSVTNDSIIVNWHGTNSAASVKLVSHNRYNCIGDTVSLPVRINIELDPEAPFGIDTLCETESIGQEYYAYLVNNTTYTWYAENGVITTGQGSDRIRVDWQEPGEGKLWFYQLSQTDTICDGISDTLSVFIQRKPHDVVEVLTDKEQYQAEEEIKLTFVADSLMDYVNLKVNGDEYRDSIPIHTEITMLLSCPGSYNIEVEAFDTLGLCLDRAFNSKIVSVLEPELEIINVTHDLDLDSTLHINWKLRNTMYSTEDYYLQRDTGTWQTIDTLKAKEGSKSDVRLATVSSSFAYQIVNENDCEQTFKSREHRSILLKIDDEHKLYWNTYEGWVNGISEYHIERKVDNNQWRVIQKTTLNDYEYINDTVGFDHCFRILALENNGNTSTAYSNVACDFFIPELNAFNVITPNDDSKNELFIITNVEFYPQGRLQIFNRWGSQVYEKTGYQNDWDGRSNSNLLPNGVYYYVFELNEPRIELKQVSGQVSILR